MNYAELANPGVLEQPVYEPGKPIEDVAREYGLELAGIAKLASNENPFGPSPEAMRAATAALRQCHIYPDGACLKLRERLVRRHGGLPVEHFLVGNGSNELIELLGHVFLRPGVDVVMGERAFIVYKLVTLLFGARAVEVPMRDHAHDLDAMRAAITPATRLVFVASPNNPTGPANTPRELENFVRSLPPGVVCVLDEAYAEYLEVETDVVGLIREGFPVVGLRTFSKIFGLGGLRIGYGYGPAGLMALLQRVRQPFNVNSIAQAAAVAALDDAEFVGRCKSANAAGRTQLVDGLRALGVETVPGDANFVMARTGDAGGVFRHLQARGVIVRPLGAYGMPDHIRVTIGKPEENARFLALLEGWLGEVRDLTAARRSD